MTVRAVDAIERTRDGAELTDAEIAGFVEGYCSGDVPDYQMSAWLMAVTLRGVTRRECAALTRAMLASGTTVALPDLGRPAIDKHATGGVGDKTTLVVAPLAASLGLAVPALSGRGLAHTGGTLDKLEAIPGFRSDLSTVEFVRVLSETGVAVAGATAEIVPADQRMYALRDVTGTVPSVPLIVASILSKKLAVESDGVVLDVKVGEGAFLRDVATARTFADWAVAVGEACGRRVRAVLTAMDEPLGLAVGNAPEVREAVAALRGDGPADLVEVCVHITAHMLALGHGTPVDEALAQARSRLRSGAAWDSFARWIAAQGGDVAAVERDALPRAPRRIEVTAAGGGTVARVHALGAGRLAVVLGAGRSRKGDAVDPAAGIDLLVRRGDAVEPGQPLAVLHTSRDGDAAEWIAAMRAAVEIGAAPSGNARPVAVLGEVVSAG